MQQCGFCSLLSSLFRNSMCFGNRGESSEASCYQEIGQDTKEKQKLKPVRARSRFTTLWFKKNADKVSIQSTETEGNAQDVATQMIELHAMPEKAFFGERFMSLRFKKRMTPTTHLVSGGLLEDCQFKSLDLMMHQLGNWNFNAFSLDNLSGGRCLPVVCISLFQKYDLTSYFNLDIVKLWKLFTMVEQGYDGSNPYHNTTHAVDVTQAMHCFMQQNKILEHLEPVEIMTSLLAAITHDLDHPGVNQSYLVATSDYMAKMYENTSVLENHHWRAAMSCIIESGVFDHLPELMDGLREQLSSLIMATDITRQQEYLNRFKEHLDKNTLDMTKKEHRHLVLQMALKCADISNPCRPWEISNMWSTKVCEEFFRQGDYERQRNLPVNLMCDRFNNSIPKIQTGFFKFIVKPLITEWHRFLNNGLSNEMLENFKTNENKWERLEYMEEKEINKKLLEVELVDKDNEAGARKDLSGSSELLLSEDEEDQLPENRAGSEIRRFSVPLNTLQEKVFPNKDNRQESSIEEAHGDDMALLETEGSWNSHLNYPLHYKLKALKRTPSVEKLLPDNAEASTSTQEETTQMITVLRTQGIWKMLKQQKFPMFCPPTSEAAVTTQPLHTTDKYFEFPPLDFDVEECLKNIPKDVDDGKEKSAIQSEIEDAIEDLKRNYEKMNTKPDNTAQDKAENLEVMMPQREPLPSDTVSFTQKEKNLIEMTPALPEMLAGNSRTVSGKEYWPRRRGSAPVSVAPSDLRLLTAIGPMKHGVSGGSRKPNHVATCQQSVFRAPYAIQEWPMTHFPRRSSLPVEVITGISSR